MGASMLGARRLLADCNQFGQCTSQVNFAQFAQHAYGAQYMSEWCWAACISMVFAFNGHAVPQSRIVTEAYGAPINMPAVYGIVIAQQLNPCLDR
jgi:hypothetical protein